MDKYRYEIRQPRGNDDFIVSQYRQFYNDDGSFATEGTPHHARYFPGDDVSKLPWHVRVVIQGRYVKTIKDRFNAEKLYKAAKENLQNDDKQENKDAEQAAKQALKDAEKAHEEFIRNES